MHILIPFLVPTVVLGIFGLIIWGSITQARKARKNLEDLATQLGLKLDEPAGKGLFSLNRSSLVGTFRGRAAQVYAYTTGSGKHRTAWCALSLHAPVAPGFEVRISGENLLTKAGRIFGIDDAATGDPAFDAQFYVKSRQGNYVRAALIPEVRMRLMEAWKNHGAHGSFTVDSTGVKYAETGTFANQKLCSRFPALLEIAADLAEIAAAWRDGA